jgi:hypothetical protein
VATITNEQVTNKVMAFNMETMIAESQIAELSTQELKKRDSIDFELDKRFAQYITEGLFGK